MSAKLFDNSGRPRSDYLDALKAKSDEDFVKHAETRIWLSAYANNNPRSDYHWQADACYDEAERRGRPDLYKRAYQQACRSEGIEP